MVMMIFEDAAVCAWCGEVVVLVDKIGMINLPRKKWIHKQTQQLHCENGKSAATPEESEHYDE